MVRPQEGCPKRIFNVYLKQFTGFNPSNWATGFVAGPYPSNSMPLGEVFEVTCHRSNHWGRFGRGQGRWIGNGSLPDVAVKTKRAFPCL